MLFIVCLDELIYGEARLENETPKSSPRDFRMVRYGKSCEMARFSHNNVAPALTGDLPAQFFERF